MPPKRTLLTQEQFDMLGSIGGWGIDEVPKEHWGKIPGLQRIEDTVGVMASGCYQQPKLLNAISAVAGVDVLVHEANPQVDKNENEGNAYHYAVQRINDSRFPYILHGPFRSETIVEHWFDYEDLDAYWKAE